tara:strand:+ start:360 stop:491 length:132 start_codon:yes stop_codon:yes gene_type:complete
MSSKLKPSHALLRSIVEFWGRKRHNYGYVKREKRKQYLRKNQT